MILSDARYLRNDGYAQLELKVDGLPARLSAECKPAVYGAGWVFLGSLFADVVPPVEFHLAGPDQGSTTLKGFTDDPRVYRLYTDFLKATAAGTFREGPVAIPA